MIALHITKPGNRTVKSVTRLAINPAKPAPALPAVAGGVMSFSLGESVEPCQ